MCVRQPTPPFATNFPMLFARARDLARSAACFFLGYSRCSHQFLGGGGVVLGGWGAFRWECTLWGCCFQGAIAGCESTPARFFAPILGGGRQRLVYPSPFSGWSRGRRASPAAPACSPCRIAPGAIWCPFISREATMVSILIY